MKRKSFKLKYNNYIFKNVQIHFIFTLYDDKREIYGKTLTYFYV